MGGGDMEIVVEEMSVCYRQGTSLERQALSDLTLKIPAGTFAGVVGATGSGKSTLIRVLGGLLPPTRGRVRIGGEQITPEHPPPASLMSRIGVVFQFPEHQLFAETVAEDIAYGPRNLGLPEEEVMRRVRRAMEWVGLSPELAERSPFHLSGGEMRRAAVAGVLAMEPQLLLLDEPTAGLDPAGRRELMERIRFLHRERGWAFFSFPTTWMRWPIMWTTCWFCRRGVASSPGRRLSCSVGESCPASGGWICRRWFG